MLNYTFLKYFLIFLFFHNTNIFCKEIETKRKEATLQIDSLDKPIELSGKWLFTRNDKKNNSKNETDLKSWKIAALPASWGKIYGDKKLYTVAWHKRLLSFNESLIGQKVTLYAVTFWPEFELYLDGNLILSQGVLKSKKEYITTGGMVTSFKITKKVHTLTVRFKTFLMKGFHAKPFQLRAYQENDLFINFWDFILTDSLVLGGSAAFMAGLLFLFVYLKTKENFYRVPSFMGIVCGLSLIGWAGLFNRFIGTNASASLFYATLLPSAIYSALFVRHYIKIKWYWFTPSVVCGVCSVIFLFFINPESHHALFLTLRKIGFAMAIPNEIILITLMVKNRRPFGTDFTPLLLGQISLGIFSGYSVFSALGIINGYNVVQFGFMSLIFVVLYLSAKNFAKTYLDNQKNLKEVTELKDNLEIKVEERTVELAEEKNSVSNLLHNMSQAVFSVDLYGVIQNKAISEYSNILFNQSIAGKTVYETLYANIDPKSEDYGNLKSALETSIGGNDLQWDLNESYFIHKTTINVKGEERIISVLPNPIWGLDEDIKEIMFSCEDITEKVALEEKVAKTQAESNKRSRALHELAPHDGKGIAAHSKELKMFLSNSDLLLNESNEIIEKSNAQKLDQKKFDTVFRHLHTLKGNARGFGATLLSEQIHKSESDLEEIKNKFDSFNEEKRLLVCKELSQIRELLDYFIKVAEEVFSISIDGTAGEVVYYEVHKDNLASMERALNKVMSESPSNDLSDLFLNFTNLLKTPLKDFLSGFKKIVDETAEESGKNVSFQVEGDDIYIGQDEQNLLNDSLIHLVRNSVDHGIEGSEIRVKENKNEVGNIVISVKKNKNGYGINIKDDGAGIDSELVTKKAIENGIVSNDEAQNMTEADKLKLIFKAGLSTKDQVSELSGRGVGMDVVSTNIKKLGGEIDIKTEKGVGTHFSISIKL
ncbi:ATP-binding protein [Bacteriovoracales bacterium]|nr:ATP-binding protein [Bacteriovoracales bacterium]